MQGIGPEEYDNQLRTPLSKTAFESTYTNPLSVHFSVTETGAIQYHELHLATYGLDCIDLRHWPDLTHIQPLDANGPFIHIAWFGEDLLSRHLVNLLCCLALEYGIIFPILAGSDLQSNRPYLQIPQQLKTCVEDCVASGGVAPPNPIIIDDRLTALEQCCLEVKTKLLYVDQRLYHLEEASAAHEQRIDNLETSMQSVIEQLIALPGILEAIRILQEQVAGILIRCCPQTNPGDGCFHYQLVAGQEMMTTPNQPIWLNLPKKITDQTPPIVIPGPLWKAKLLGSCNWVLEAMVRFRVADWCAGTKARLFLVYCGQKYLLDELAIPAEGFQSVTLEFTIPIPSGCSDVHLLVETTDKVGKIIEFASFKGCPRC